jgi:hypothetical protein
VHEDIRAVLAREEAETLLRVEPLDLAGGHVGSLGCSLPGPARGRGDDGGVEPLARQVSRLVAARALPSGACRVAALA